MTFEDKTTENLEFDFIIETEHLMKMYPHLTKEQATKRRYYWKCKLKKPRGGAVLASEMAAMLGISLKQLRGLTI